MSLVDGPSTGHPVAQVLRSPAVELRCGVRKHIAQASPNGTELSRPHAHVTIAYALYQYVPAKAPRKVHTAPHHRGRPTHRGRRGAEYDIHSSSDDSSDVDAAAEDDVPAGGTYTMVEQRSAVALTLGISNVLPGLEIGVQSMREGEQALFVVPSSVGHTSVRGRLATGGGPLYFLVTLKSMVPVSMLVDGTLKFTQTAAKDTQQLRPKVDDVVSVGVRSTNPITQVRDRMRTLEFAIGSAEASPFDAAVLSMRVGDMATVFVDQREHMLALLKVVKASPVMLERNTASNDDTGSTSTDDDAVGNPCRSLDVDPLVAGSLHCPASFSERFADVDRRRQTGRLLMANGEPRALAKASWLFRRAASTMLAAPSMVDPSAPSEVRAKAREVLSVVHTNCGRALLKLSRVDAALKAAAEAIKHNPQYAKAAFLHGQCLRHVGELAASVAAFKACLQLPLSDDERAETLRELKHAEGTLAESNAKNAGDEAPAAA